MFGWTGMTESPIDLQTSHPTKDMRAFLRVYAGNSGRGWGQLSPAHKIPDSPAFLGFRHHHQPSPTPRSSANVRDGYSSTICAMTGAQPRLRPIPHAPYRAPRYPRLWPGRSCPRAFDPTTSPSTISVIGCHTCGNIPGPG